MKQVNVQTDKEFFSNWPLVLRHEPADWEIEQAKQFSDVRDYCSPIVAAIAVYVRDVFADNSDLQEIHVASREYRTTWRRDGGYKLRFVGPTEGCDQTTAVLFDDLWDHRLDELKDGQGFENVPSPNPRPPDGMPF